ncbi:MAG: hypothetical protein CFK52_11495 [Chloracidobacterium sp. CP2_5A]|nr:MAG: hypothetical protein CFK52_11495 [Chloracidobacterium sp. CP2_5A]
MTWLTFSGRLLLATLWRSSAIGVLAGSSQPLDATDVETACRLEASAGSLTKRAFAHCSFRKSPAAGSSCNPLRSVELLRSNAVRLEDITARLAILAIEAAVTAISIHAGGQRIWPNAGIATSE